MLVMCDKVETFVLWLQSLDPFQSIGVGGCGQNEDDLIWAYSPF
jgi:hypothetical protein